MNVNHPILDVPYFKQTSFSTCGPASLMMIMKYWNESFRLSRKVEYELWRKSNPLVFLGGTLQYGLAATAVKMGFKAEIYQKASFSEIYSAFHNFFKLYEIIASFSAYSAKIPIHYGKEVLDVINDALTKKIPPLVLLNLKPITGENVFHWVVVTGIDDNSICVNDPSNPGSNFLDKKGILFDLKSFKKAIATDSGRILRLPPSIVLVYK